METAAQFAERVVGALAIEVSVALDALLQAGWPVSRIMQQRQGSYDPVDFETITVVLRRGIELGDDLPVFEARASMNVAESSFQVTGIWLVSPIPTPHPSTIARANPPPRPTHCSYCNNEIDVDTCWCGEEIGHDAYEYSHVPVAMGCTCLMGSP